MIQQEEDLCEYCQGEGVLSTDEFDHDSHQYQRGVGTEKCICQFNHDEE